MVKPRAVAFDLDGTLAESKQPLTVSMGVLLGRLLSLMPVALLSGASFQQFQTQFLSGLPGDAQLSHLYLFPENAGQCYVFVDGSFKSKYNHSFTKDEEATIFKAVDLAVEEFGLAAPSEVWGEQVENRGAQISFSPLGQQAPVAAKMAWHEDHDELRSKMRVALASALPDFFVVAGGLTTIDITRKGITKAFGLEQFSALTSIPLSEMLFIGDALMQGGNDSIVLTTDVLTKVTSGPTETAALIAELVNNSTQ